MNETLQQAIFEYLEAVETATQKFKQKIANQLPQNQPTQTTASENIFSVLTFEQRIGTHLGEYETAQKTTNPTETWNKAVSILEKNKSTISNRYHEEDYIHSYWLYGEDHNRIYRQKLKRQNLHG
jgi:hypothetical protein